jgi:hypothetical protein
MRAGLRERWLMTSGFWALGLVLLSAHVVYAITPLDGIFTNLLASMPLWGQALVGVGGLLIALGGITLLQGPTMLIPLIIGFCMLLVVAMSSSGALYNWLISMAV